RAGEGSARSQTDLVLEKPEADVRVPRKRVAIREKRQISKTTTNIKGRSSLQHIVLIRHAVNGPPPIGNILLILRSASCKIIIGGRRGINYWNGSAVERRTSSSNYHSPVISTTRKVGAVDEVAINFDAWWERRQASAGQ